MKSWLSKYVRGSMTDDEFQQWREDLIACVAGFAALMVVGGVSGFVFWILTL